MRYIGAYLLATLGGNTSPTPEDIEKILGSVGIDVDNERLDILFKNLADKNIDEILANGISKLANFGSAGASSASAGPSAGNDAAAAAPVEEKIEEKEEEEEADLGGGMDMFGGGSDY